MLTALFAIWWAVLAVAPWYRKDWALENALVVAFAAFAVFSYQRLILSRVSYTLIFAFLCLHEIGAHYTYAEVPYDAAFKALTGVTLNSILGWQRNNFDRVAHFAYGFLITYPLREIFVRVSGARGFWSYFVPLDFVMSTSMIFELFEWAAAELFGGDLGQAYLGTQGDVWDAHKDMALASLGALMVTLLAWAISRLRHEDLASAWAARADARRAPFAAALIARPLEDTHD